MRTRSRSTRHRPRRALNPAHTDIARQQRHSVTPGLRGALAVGTLLSATALAAGGAWLGVEALLNQDVACWLEQQLPGSSQTGDRLQTQSQIKASIRASGRLPGKALNLTPIGQLQACRDLVIPVLSQPRGTSGQAVVELRVYRSLKLPYLLQWLSAHQYFRLVDQMNVTGPQELQVLMPVGTPKLANYGSTRILPLTELVEYTGQGVSGWLNLSGLTQGDATTRYGQILYYNRDQAQLNLMLHWRSPAGDQPSWQEVTGGEAPELVVNQTVGLEPQFVVYQVQPARTKTLQAISLSEPAAQQQAYRNGLLLAQSGLWSPALRWLKANHGSKTVQAQIDVIRLHAQFTHAQAEQAWASPAQTALVYLIDGRFTAALQQALKQHRDETSSMLRGNAKRLWERVTAALQVNPAQPDVVVWGALICWAQDGKPAAIAWLQQQKLPASVHARTLKILQQLTEDEAKSKTNPAQQKAKQRQTSPQVSQSTPQQEKQRPAADQP